MDDCVATVVDVSDNSTTVSDAPLSRLFGIYVGTALSAHACPIKDGNGNTLITLVASLAAGTNLAFPGVRFPGGIVVDPNDAATGGITVFWA